jgi:hypothetical protein
VGEGQEIGEDEWRAFFEATSPLGKTVRYENPLLTKWSGHSKNNAIWFDFWKGSIAVKNPDEETLGKMKQIAEKLNARVQ